MNQQIFYKPQMQSIAECVNRPVRITQCIQAHNEEEFIGATLNSIYNEVDRIIVIEGAVENRPNSTEDGHSTDRTRDIIDDFIANKDPDNKVLLVSIKRPWKNLEEMKQTFLDMSTPGDWILINDADEFYKPEDIRRLRRAIDLEPHVQEWIPLFVHYYRDLKHVASPAAEWQPLHQRCFRYERGMRYVHHPTVYDPAGRDTYFSPEYWHRRKFLNNWFIHHLGYARSNMDQVMLDKQKYYTKELAAHGGANKKFDEKVDIWINKKERSQDFLSVPYDFCPVHLGAPDNEHMAALNCPDITSNDLYNKALNGEPFGTMWLNQTGQALPHIPYFHNETKVD